MCSVRVDASFIGFTSDDVPQGTTNTYASPTNLDSYFATKTTSNLSEGTNLYYTQARFDTAFSGKSTTNLSEGTNLYYTQARFDSAFTAKSTTNLSEGTNLYYTNARARASISASVALAYDSSTGIIDARRNRSSYVLVRALSDLPAPVSGVITLVDNTAYEINGTIAFGTNTLVVGTNSRIFGVSRQTDILQYTGTGTFMSITHALLANDIGISCANGTLLSCAAGSTDRIRFHRCQFDSIKTLGAITTGALFEILSCNITNGTTSGFTISGTAFGIFDLSDCYLENNAGTFLALGSATLSGVKIEETIVKLSSGQTFLSGTAPVITFSSVIANTFLNSSGTVVSGISINATNWFFFNNFGIDNTQYVGEAYMQANATGVVVATAGTYVKGAGTTTAGANNNFTHASNRLTYNGNFTSTFLVVATLTIQTNGGAPEDLSAAVFKNNVKVTSTEMHVDATANNQPFTLVVKGLVSLTTSDFIEIWVTDNSSSGRTITITNMNFTAVKS